MTEDSQTARTQASETSSSEAAFPPAEAPGIAAAARTGRHRPLPCGAGRSVIVGVVGGNYPPLFLSFPVLLIAASGGLMLLLRWAWALALAAVFLLAVYNMWIFSSEHLAPALVQGLLNWVFFLYLIRVEVRSKLK